MAKINKAGCNIIYLTEGVSVNVREFLRRLHNDRYFKVARANREETRVLVCASGCMSHIWPFLRSHDLHSQSSVAVAHYIPIAARFTYPPKGWNPESRLSAPGIEPGPPAHMSEQLNMRRSGQRLDQLS